MPSLLSRRRGFTLVELLVVIGIIALLISILLPSLNRARQAAKDVQCASNMRQLATAFVHYAIDNNGKFPTAYAGTSWASVEVIGTYLPQEVVTNTDTIGGNVLICSSDIDNAQRSYSMNIWASSDLHANAAWMLNATSTTGLPRGEQFANNVSNSSQMILLGEKWTQFGNNETGWFTNGVIGYPGLSPADRFLRLPAPVQTRLNSGMTAPTEIDYQRHRGNQQPSSQYPNQAYGQANFAFADGHVEMIRHTALANSETLIATGKALWSPIDVELMAWEAENPASNGVR